MQDGGGGGPRKWRKRGREGEVEASSAHCSEFNPSSRPFPRLHLRLLESVLLTAARAARAMGGKERKESAKGEGLEEKGVF